MSRSSIIASPDHARVGTRSAIRNLARALTPGILTTVLIEHGHTLYTLVNVAILGGHA